MRGAAKLSILLGEAELVLADLVLVHPRAQNLLIEAQRAIHILYRDAEMANTPDSQRVVDSHVLPPVERRELIRRITRSERGRQMRIVDIHAHFYPKEYLALLQRILKSESTPWARSVQQIQD